MEDSGLNLSKLHEQSYGDCATMASKIGSVVSAASINSEAACKISLEPPN